MKEELTLYSYRRCPFAMRVRMVLHEKGLEFKTIEEKLKEFSEELKRLHPEAKVPLLMHRDLAIYESAIITEYLDDAFPKNPLMPESAEDKMKVRQWTYWCNHIFKPEIDRFKYGPVRLTEVQVQEAKDRLTEHLRKIEGQLKKSRWLVGDQFSLADIHTFPFYRQIWQLSPSHPEIEKCQAATQWLHAILERPSFEATMRKKS